MRGGMYDVNSLDHMIGKMDALAQIVKSLVIGPTNTVVVV